MTFVAFLTGDRQAKSGSQSLNLLVVRKTGKRDSNNTEHFIEDLRQRVIGAPEISSDGWPSYPPL